MRWNLRSTATILLPVQKPAVVAIFVFIYMTTYWLSDVFRLPETGSTPWNPEAGLAMAAVYVAGLRMLPVIAITHFLCLMLWAPYSTPLWTALLAVAHMAALTGITQLGRSVLVDLGTPTTQSSTRFVALAFMTTLASAILQMLISIFATDWSLLKILRFGMTVSVGNMVGIVTLFPVLRGYPDFKSLSRILVPANSLTWLLFSMLFLTCVVVFGIESLNQFKFFYLVFVPVIALAMLHGMAGGAIAALAASISMIAVLSLRNYGATDVVELQILMIVLAITALLLGATIDERLRVHSENVAYLFRLRESEEALLRASRISLASEMAAAVSHELAQPLSAARSHIRALRRRLVQPRPNKQFLLSDIDAAVAQIDAAGTTIRNTREFLRRGDNEKANLKLSQVLQSSLELVKPELRRSNIQIAEQGLANLPEVVGNRTQITQVLLNLVRNARDAMVDADSAGRRIEVAASTAMRPGFVEISVTDCGPGVAADVVPRLFAPLQSNKPEGLGLGLSLSSSIVLAHGGSLWHDAAFSSGARFVFTLPLATDNSTEKQP